jgi:hypothetical protein
MKWSGDEPGEKFEVLGSTLNEPPGAKSRRDRLALFLGDAGQDKIPSWVTISAVGLS